MSDSNLYTENFPPPATYRVKHPHHGLNALIGVVLIVIVAGLIIWAVIAMKEKEKKQALCNKACNIKNPCSNVGLMSGQKCVNECVDGVCSATLPLPKCSDALCNKLNPCGDALLGETCVNKCVGNSCVAVRTQTPTNIPLLCPPGQYFYQGKCMSGYKPVVPIITNNQGLNNKNTPYTNSIPIITDDQGIEWTQTSDGTSWTQSRDGCVVKKTQEGVVFKLDKQGKVWKMVESAWVQSSIQESGQWIQVSQFIQDKMAVANPSNAIPPFVNEQEEDSFEVCGGKSLGNISSASSPKVSCSSVL